MKEFLGTKNAQNMTIYIIKIKFKTSNLQNRNYEKNKHQNQHTISQLFEIINQLTI